MPDLADNIGIATDRMLHAETGMVERRDGYITVRTPDSPDYFFGNLLMLRECPTTDDLQWLERDFARWIGTPPLIAHRTFAWAERVDGAVALSG
jgi:hypothetical protein